MITLWIYSEHSDKENLFHDAYASTFPHQFIRLVEQLPECVKQNEKELLNHILLYNDIREGKFWYLIGKGININLIDIETLEAMGPKDHLYCQFLITAVKLGLDKEKITPNLIKLIALEKETPEKEIIRWLDL